MAYKLVCVHDFGDYQRGQEVTDQAEIDKLMSEGRDNNFVRVAVADAPEVNPEDQPQA